VLGERVNAERHDRLRSGLAVGVPALLVVAGSVLAGVVTARLVAPTVHNRYFLWISGRALGIAAYLSLSALVLLGTWMRHPWRLRWPFLHGESRLRVHAALAVATIALVAAHVTALAADRYAGVGVIGALVPGRSVYRTVPVAIGVVAMYAMLVLTLSAALAGRRGLSHWLGVHRVGALTFVAVWSHGLLAGTDARALRVLYAITGLAWIILVATRITARRVDRVPPQASARDLGDPGASAPLDVALDARTRAPDLIGPGR
jgi:hypothetical protein